jgi:thiol-disulfide isomerase/thioredoxin
MTEVSNEDGKGPEPKPKAGYMKAAIIAMAGVAAVAVLYVIVNASFKPGAGSDDLHALAKGPMAKLEVATAPKAGPDTPFSGPNGEPLTLKSFDGQVVVLNIWATWCAPCVEEMPTLGKLQAEYANKPVKVVTLSIDRPEDAPDARAFLAKHGGLVLYSDPKMRLAFSLDPKVSGLPATIIFDRNGKERARLSGGADWSSPEAKAVIDAVMAGA